MTIEPESIKHHLIYLESIQELHHLHQELLLELMNKDDSIQVETVPENGLITPNILYQQKLLNTLKNQKINE